MRPNTRVLGIRHLSPACARNLLRVIDRWQPELVLLEVPEDMGAAFARIKALPAVLVAYEQAPPRRPRRLPVADYSPELMAFRRCRELGIPVRCIDLPTSLWPAAEGRDDAESAFVRFALSQGEEHFDDAWERDFEHDDYLFWERTARFGLGLRQSLFLSEAGRRREAHMLGRLREAEEEGQRRILCVCGAFHAPVLAGLIPPEAPEDFGDPGKAGETCLCVLPLSERALSTGAGYGGGNRTPAYHRMLWENPATAAPRLLTLLARRLREEGFPVSSEDIQSALSAAGELAALRGGAAVWRDLRDAALLCYPCPQKRLLSVLEDISVGGRRGEGEGDAPSPLCMDILENLRTTRLEEKIQAGKTLRLDRRKALERARSILLHRLRVLELGLSEALALPEEGAGREGWRLTARSDWMSLALDIEGDSLAEAAALRIGEGNTGGTEALLRVLRDTLLCGLPLHRALEDFEEAALQGIDAHGLVRVVFALEELLDRDGANPPLRAAKLRFFDRSLAALRPSLQGDESAVLQQLLPSLQGIAEKDGETETRWRDFLRKALAEDALSPFARGLCLSLWLARYEVPEGLAGTCFARVFGGLGAGGGDFVAGLLCHGRLRVLRDTRLWDAFDTWLGGLSETAFEALCPALYAAFWGLSPEEKEALHCQNRVKKDEGMPLSLDPAALALLQSLTEL